jgi:DNA-binding LytR/AlgR family response regulator
MIHAGEESYAIRRTLSELEARLDPARFFRAHRSAIVNLDRVEEIIPWFKRSQRLRLATGVEMDLSAQGSNAAREIRLVAPCR